jgi:hypothetical protein
MLNARLAAGTTLWLFDGQDLEAIATPTGRILARHVPVGPETGGDMADAAEIAVGVAGYALRNMAGARAHAAGATDPQAPPPPAAPATASSSAPVATPAPTDDEAGPWAPTETVESSAFHDHFPPLP